MLKFRKDPFKDGDGIDSKTNICKTDVVAM